MKKCENEEKLVLSAQKGNAEAFGSLVRHYEGFVFNVAFSFMNNYDDAFDVAQEAFVKAWRALAHFKGSASFSTWLYRITANTAKDALAERRRRWSDTEIYEGMVASEDTPEDSVVRDESVRELRCALGTLDEGDRELLVLREFEGYSYEELARHFEIELGTVKSRLNRARAKLREKLREQNPEYCVKYSENR